VHTSSVGPCRPAHAANARYFVRSAAIKTVGAPIPPLAVGVIFEVDATMPPELPSALKFQADDALAATSFREPLAYHL